MACAHGVAAAGVVDVGAVVGLKKIITVVVDATENGAVPVARVEVICPVALIVVKAPVLAVPAPIVAFTAPLKEVNAVKFPLFGVVAPIGPTKSVPT